MGHNDDENVASKKSELETIQTFKDRFMIAL